MDAHKPVTLEEGDRYPLGLPVTVFVLMSVGIKRLQLGTDAKSTQREIRRTKSLLMFWSAV
jgi:hypothetical protein